MYNCSFERACEPVPQLSKASHSYNSWFKQKQYLGLFLGEVEGYQVDDFSCGIG